MKTVAQEIASAVEARLNCIESKNHEWRKRHGDRIKELATNRLPSGSGVDDGTHVDLDTSTRDKLVLHCGFHHMNESGMYDGWTEHVVTVRPSFSGFDIRISGRDRNGIKEYLYQAFHDALSAEVES